MKTVTLRISPEAEEAIREIMIDQGQNTGSKALMIALKAFMIDQKTIRDQWAEMEDMKLEIEELKATIRYLR